VSRFGLSRPVRLPLSLILKRGIRLKEPPALPLVNIAWSLQGMMQTTSISIIHMVKKIKGSTEVVLKKRGYKWGVRRLLLKNNLNGWTAEIVVHPFLLERSIQKNRIDNLIYMNFCRVEHWNL
jgi:hypothetical protein